MTEAELLKIENDSIKTQAIAVDYWSKELCQHGSPFATVTSGTPLLVNAIVDLLKAIPRMLAEIKRLQAERKEIPTP